MASNKHVTIVDFASLDANYSSPSETTSQNDSQSNGNNKRKASPNQKHTGKIIKGPPKSFGLSQIIESGGSAAQSVIVRNECPWDTFHEVFSCMLAGSVSIAVHRTRPSRVIAIREYPPNDSDKMLLRFRQIQHENIITAKECYRFQDHMYALVDDLPLTLEHLVGCRSVYPSECQLASIITQVLNGLSYLIINSIEHEALTCSNILLGLNGVIKIAGLEFCVDCPPNQSQAQSINALAIITMELMQKYEKEDGVVGVDDLDRWPIDSDAVAFLSATSSAISIQALKQHPLVTKQYRSPRELVGLARFALISTKTFYSYKA